MAKRYRVTINGQTIFAREGELLLDAALSNGIALPYDCRAGHCGTCCIRLLSGEVQGGAGAEPGVVHACKCRVVADAELDRGKQDEVRSVSGDVTSLRDLSPEVVEVGIATTRSLPHHPGQYAQVSFSGYPSRPFSITHPICSEPGSASLWFHVRRMTGGAVTPVLGTHIRQGHRVTVKGPYGSAHFRPQHNGRLILVATNTGFAPIWSIAVAALRENPDRMIMIIAGGRELSSLYMGPALVRLAKFSNVLVVPVCSTPQTRFPAVRPGRPTDYLPHILPTDMLYVCGAPGMVDAVKSVADAAGATCHADPFMPAHGPAPKQGLVARTLGRLAASKTVSGRQREWGERVEPDLPTLRLAKG